MKLSTLVDATTLSERIRASDTLVVDCRFDLADPPRASRDHAQGHIPGAIYASLDDDLSDLSKTGLGRHPLPDAAAFSATPVAFIAAVRAFTTFSNVSFSWAA